MGQANDLSGQHIWDLWFPHAAATGMSLARGRLDATDVLLVHAAPEVLDVAVRNDNGRLLAQGRELLRTAERPMARLTVRGSQIERLDLWPRRKTSAARLSCLPRKLGCCSTGGMHQMGRNGAGGSSFTTTARRQPGHHSLDM